MAILYSSDLQLKRAAGKLFKKVVVRIRLGRWVTFG
jgi:hypothetical protein